MWYVWGRWEVLKGFGGKPERKRPLGRPRRRCEDNIKMYVQEVVWWGGMDWINLAQDTEGWRALVTAVMNFRFLQNVGNFLTWFLKTDCGPCS